MEASNECLHPDAGTYRNLTLWVCLGEAQNRDFPVKKDRQLKSQLLLTFLAATLEAFSRVWPGGRAVRYPGKEKGPGLGPGPKKPYRCHHAKAPAQGGKAGSSGANHRSKSMLSLKIRISINLLIKRETPTVRLSKADAMPDAR
jgi:hypothetical protein